MHRKVSELRRILGQVAKDDAEQIAANGISEDRDMLPCKGIQ